MTNGEKYKSAKERGEAFGKWALIVHHCDRSRMTFEDAFAWLDLEAPAEEPLPCPFCGKSCSTKFNHENRLVVECDFCCYSTASYDDEMKAISAHNRVARAVAKVKEMENAKIVLGGYFPKMIEANDANA